MANKKFALILLIAILIAATVGALIAVFFPNAAVVGAIPGAIVVTWGVSEISQRITASLQPDELVEPDELVQPDETAKPEASTDKRNE